MKQPHEYSQRTLFIVIGMTPQIVTETLYALAVKRQPAFIPTEIKIVTTRQGAEQVRLNLLSDAPGWFGRFCRDYQLSGIRFSEDDIQVLTRPDGQLMEDIREPEDNEQMADVITETIRQLTRDPERAVHVSIAGGRKTMGFYAGYALSLFGREQDRLSHVLVEKDFESLKEFYYPTPYNEIIQPGEMPFNAATARVVLAEIPFVSLRHGLPENLSSGHVSFSDTVQVAKKVMAETSIVFDLNKKTLKCADQTIKLPPREYAFYYWFALRKIHNKPPVRWADDIGNDFMEICEQIYHPTSGHLERLKETLRNPAAKESEQYIMEKEFFQERISKIKTELAKAVGKTQVNRYFINTVGKRPETRYEFAASPNQIHFK